MDVHLNPTNLVDLNGYPIESIYIHLNVGNSFNFYNLRDDACDSTGSITNLFI
jgi:hypothetical protein